MKHLMFDNEDKEKVSLDNFSKSFLGVFETCPLKAWKKKRSFEEDSTRELSVGKASHEYFATELQRLDGKKYEPHVPFSPSILKEAKELADSVDYDRLLTDAEIMFVEKKVTATLPNKTNLIGIFDLVLGCDDEFIGEFVKIVDYKTGFKISKDIDDEALIYGYLATKEFGMPVMFARVSGRSGDYWEHYFTLEDALAYEDFITSYTNEVKKVIESEEAPFPMAGSHCSTCPFLDNCISKGFSDENLDEMITQQALYEAKAKELKSKIKDLAVEKGGNYQSDLYTASIKESKSKKLMFRDEKTKQNKALNKKDFVRMLADSNELNLFLDVLDIKYTPEVLEKAERLGLIVGENIRREISIDLNSGKSIEEEEDENEE